MQNLIDPTVGLIVGLVVIVLLIVGAGLIVSARKSSKNPTFDAVLDALMPFVYRAIVAGEKSAVQALKKFDLILEGSEKQQIADNLYNLIPDTLVIGGKAIPVNVIKRIVTKDDFSNLVKNFYDETSAFIQANATYIEKQVRDFLPDPFEIGLESANNNPPPSPDPMS